MDISSFTSAIVVQVEDDMYRTINDNRVKVRVPTIHGPSSAEDLPDNIDNFKIDKNLQWTPDENLPWASIIFPVGSTSYDKSSLFQVGQIVYVIFPYDDLTKPYIIGVTGIGGEVVLGNDESLSDEASAELSDNEGESKYTKSSLVKRSILSPNCSERTAKIVKITPHHAAGITSAESLAKIFSTRSRNASCNYAIGKNGEVICVVPENKRAYTSSNRNNDNQAITFELSNDSMAPSWHISNATINSFINMSIDICKRNNIPSVNFTGTKDGVITFHCMFAATECPGPYLKSIINDVVYLINEGLAGRDHTFPRS